LGRRARSSGITGNRKNFLIHPEIKIKIQPEKSENEGGLIVPAFLLPHLFR
jgi:hypothetical protein